MAIKRNPPLVIFGNPRSETNAWRTVQQLAEGLTGNAVAKRKLQEIAETMIAQVKGGVHQNPRGGECFGRDVQAIVYVHEETGERMVHQFGGKDPSARDLARGILNLSKLPSRTGAKLYAMPDGSLAVRSGRGQSLWGDYA